MSYKEQFGLRALCFCACVPSGGALLAQVYGLAPMRLTTLAVALPSCAALVAVWLWARRAGREHLAGSLEIGFMGGLLGTLAYDIARVPFALVGQRVFAPISAYGIWIADAAASSRFTEVAGWTYHFSNGITFGLMYALFMRGQHWGWALVWAFALETIAVWSPFARIFYLSGNYYAIGIAYLGHIAYGLPLGWLVYRWDESREGIAALPAAAKWLALLMAAAAIVWPLVSPQSVARDARVVAGEFRIEGERLNPAWLRLERGGAAQVYNPGMETVFVRVRQNGARLQIESAQRGAFAFSEPGLYQVFVETERQSRSSFVIVEPVEEFRERVADSPQP